MKTISTVALLCSLVFCVACPTPAQQTRRPYRLNGVDLKQRVIWGAECRQPENQGLTFGGQDQDSDDGRPHTRVLSDGQWKAIHRALRAANPLQKLHKQIWLHRLEAKNILARARFAYFQGLSDVDEVRLLEREVVPSLSRLAKDLAAVESKLPTAQTDEYAAGQVGFARHHLQRTQQQWPSFENGATADALQRLHQIQIQLELAAETLDAEPPPRAMNCGVARLANKATGQPGNTLIYDANTKLYVLFGGDHLDYLTNDTWIFDPTKRRWFQRHPVGAPSPRANHRLEAIGDGTVRMTGGYTYSSNTDYVGGQYIDLNDGPWVYDIAKNTWSGGKLATADSRVYRSGPFHPDHYLKGTKPDAIKFDAWLSKLPANEWMPTNPPHLPRLNRDWGTARIDPSRNMMLRWSGGHSAHGGTDVLHYHFATNRWELPFPVEFPLGQLYSNTSYPNVFNFNKRPWMTGHTYQNYDYDPPSKMMIKAGRPRHFYVYDPDVGDWIGRGKKPAAMQYNSCFYTLTLTATPGGIVCWDKNGKVHRYSHGEGNGDGKWVALELTGDKLPGAYVDNSTIAYDSKRDRVLIINTPGYKKPYSGQVWSVDLKTNRVTGLSPQGGEHAGRFANVDKCCYDADHDLLLLGTYLKDAGEAAPTPAYDCRNNRWITLDLKYSTGKRYGNTTRAFPHRRSDGLMYDARRKLIWGTNTNSQVYVLRLDLDQANVQPLR
jgi:hypothetical protein